MPGERAISWLVGREEGNVLATPVGEFRVLRYKDSTGERSEEGEKGR